MRELRGGPDLARDESRMRARSIEERVAAIERRLS
jgi:hypothetical protein